VKLDWSEPDATGRRTFREIPGRSSTSRRTSFCWRWDSSTWSTGPWFATWGIDGPARNLVVNGNLQSSVPGVFGAGDAVAGASLVVRAIDLGRLAAEGVDRFLSGKK